MSNTEPSSWEQAKDWIGKLAALLGLVHAGMEAWDAFNSEIDETGTLPPIGKHSAFKD